MEAYSLVQSASMICSSSFVNFGSLIRSTISVCTSTTPICMSQELFAGTKEKLLAQKKDRPCFRHSSLEAPVPEVDIARILGPSLHHDLVAPPKESQVFAADTFWICFFMPRFFWA